MDGIAPRASRCTAFVIAVASLCSVARGIEADEDPASNAFFEARIRPVLVDHCLDCHGADDPEGGLRLDTKAGWERGGERGPAIVPGDPTSSLLIRAVTYDNADLKMPPEDAGGKLSERQIDDLIAWVRRGAVDPRTGDRIVTDIEAAARTHWAFQPVAPPEIDADENPIDVLIDRKLQESNFTPTARADLRTLVRRATFDLHGLPPTEDQMAAAEASFPEFVDMLLASPRYGERWGRHWLDVARYSDAKDGVLMYGDARIRPFAYTYRDYVIRAFNNDKPFDDFIREQIAADQLALPEDSPDLAAMGFLTLGRMFDNNRHDVIDDQIDVVTRGFLGLTATCARCHDHKFDPIPTADYYSLYGVFASCREPYDRPRIGPVTDDGAAFESEFSAKLSEVVSKQNAHYQETLQTARERTADYLVEVATTEPDVAETTIFFLSLIPDQLRPQITWRWRQLIARRAFPDDPVFGPWHDLMREPQLRPDEWRARGVDQRVIDGLVAANPQSPTDVARTYGEIIHDVWSQEQRLLDQIAEIDTGLTALEGGSINLADIVAGGSGYGGGERGGGIHPATGEPTTGETGMIAIERPDELVAVPDNRFVDGVFVPKSTAVTATSTGLRIEGLPETSGQTWDYIKYGPSSGFTVNTISGTDYSAEPHWMLALHANKGVTFDIEAMRAAYGFQASRFRTLFGHGGAEGESRLDFAVYLDGRRVVHAPGFRAQQAGLEVDVEIPASARFLTLVVTEGEQGISHDQAILGNPRIVPDATEHDDESRRERRVALEQQKEAIQAELEALSLETDPIGSLLVSRESPVWFPREDIYYYLSRSQKDAFRGLVNQLDALAVQHAGAAPRGMVLVDSEVLTDPVIFQRGDPGQRGAPVPRRFLRVLSPSARSPFPDGSGRVNLANAIASPDNPLTARVWVNRVWMHHFGEPLVVNPGDFGLQTPRPVHAELLDYLADYFTRSGWRTKPLHRLIMSSRCYQRASRVPEGDQFARQLETDPDNALLWRANRRRLDFEQMRDSILAVSGQLDLRMYGRPGLLTDAGNRRRTVYAFVERQNIPDMVKTFDVANADTSTSRRTSTTVPQQALFAMNAPFVINAAKALADGIDESEAESDRIVQLYQRALSRPPSADEVGLAETFLKGGSLQQLAQILLISNEFMFVD